MVNRAGKPLKDKREKPGDAADDLRLRSPNGALTRDVGRRDF